MHAHQRLPQRHAERELIAARIELPLEVLLGRHERRRAQQRAGAGEARHLGRVERSLAVGLRQVDPLAAPRQLRPPQPRREPEVHHLHAPVRVDEDVGRLEVAVQHPGAMRRDQARARLQVRVEDLLARAWPTLRAPLPVLEGASLHVLHGDERALVVLARLEHLDHVGVRDLGHRLRLAAHAGAPRLTRARLASQQLDRHPSSELIVERREHLAHAPATDPTQHHEAADHVGRRGEVVLEALLVVLRLPEVGVGVVARGPEQPASPRISFPLGPVARNHCERSLDSRSSASRCAPSKANGSRAAGFAHAFFAADG